MIPHLGLLRFVTLLWVTAFLCLAVSPSLAGSSNENARTLYEGYVEIDPLSLDELKTRLDAVGCHEQKMNVTGCSWLIRTDDPGIEIYPHGPGFGPLSFHIDGKKLSATKDIPGAPDFEAFKSVVRKDIKDTGTIVSVKDDSWVLVKTQYPWTVLY